MPFFPFSSSTTSPAPWSPLSCFDLDQYVTLRKSYDNYLPDGISVDDAERSSIRLSRIATIVAPNKLSTPTNSSGIWDQLISNTSPLTKSVPISIYSMMKSIYLYHIHLLPVHGISSYSPFATHSTDSGMQTEEPTQHLPLPSSSPCVMRLGSLVSGSSLSEMGKENGKQPPYRMLSRTNRKTFFGRPCKPISAEYAVHVFEFLRLQLLGISGSLPPDHHLVYLMLAGPKPYVGRTAKTRSFNMGLHGMWAKMVRACTRT